MYQVSYFYLDFFKGFEMEAFFYDSYRNRIKKDVFCVANLAQFERDMDDSYEYWAYNFWDLAEMLGKPFNYKFTFEWSKRDHRIY